MDYEEKYLLLSEQYSREIDKRDALIDRLGAYVEYVPDDRLNATHLDRDALVEEAKEILDVVVFDA